MTGRLTVVLLICSAIGTIALGQAAPASPQGQTVTLRIGDRMDVEGQPVGCRVTRKSGQVMVECRRAGKLQGTYGTYIGRRTAMVARFKSRDVAKVVFVGRHRHGSRTCTR
jgi:hypothetical protein